MLRFYSLMGMLMLLCTLSFAQTKPITGKVTDARDGSPLPGVTVKGKGTNTGTVSTVDGTFKFNVPAQVKTLVFSFIGYADQQVELGNNTTFNVQLGSDKKELSEVVVLGFGTQTKKDLTGSVAKVSAKDFENQPMPTMETALQGRVTGVYVNSGSGKLGQAADIKIRGTSSVNAGQRPLYVVDGVPIIINDIGTTDAEPTNPLASIDPNEIESMSVLKDASSAAIYGARGANGVVLITTKRGKAGRTSVTANISGGTSKPTHLRKFLNAKQYRELFTEAAKNGGVTDIAGDFASNSGSNDWNNNFDTDWNGAAFRNGSFQDYSLSVNAGDEKTRFYFSGVLNKQVGIIIGNDLQRFGGRLNVEHNISSKAIIGVNINVMKTAGNRLPNDNAFDNPVQLNALPPIQPLRDSLGRYNNSTIYYNNLINLTDGKNIMQQFTGIGDVYLSYNILPNLTFKTDYGFNFLQLDEETYAGRRTQTGGGKNGVGVNAQGKGVSQVFTNTLNYTKDWHEHHNLGVLVGIMYDDYNERSNSVTGENYPNDQFQKIQNAAKITAGTSFETGNAHVSYISRVNYKFMDKYLLQANVNVNGSSRFGFYDKKYRYGVFPGVQAGWVISQESFLKYSKAINFLKLRASYGLTGNDNIGDFDSRSLIGSINYADKIGLVPSRLAASDLHWETMHEVDLGLDFGLINNRLTGTLDLYQRKTMDMLLNINIPATGGFTSLRRNVGSMQNRGVEIGLNSRNLVGEFQWSTNFSITLNRNKVLDDGGSPIEPNSRNLGRIAAGQPFGYFYGKKFAGVDPQNGDALYATADGKTTNDYNAAPNMKIGDPNPNFFGGFGNNFAYKNFYLDVQTQFVSGNDIYNQAGSFQSSNAPYYDNQTIDQMTRWQKPGDITKVPKAILYGSNGDKKSSRWVEKGSFFRVKSVTFGYNVPKKVMSGLKLQSARIYMAANNLFTFTNYSGYDPEVNTSYLGALQLGHDFYTPPQAKTITFGINVGF
ncbi:TonB-linked SusC/RagA family outer membrane protein [Chitinophaga niastensis]|uniref:TonB-linked SusC/RagA family outer membrane protein n=1 Tax=Chitinophaga niastensis TaxID=536980 RepID=A0A2P8HSI8_CHINA|nr:TonB-dependent receptor [Chitinophaga niastensis]PSL49162.1 TonB-linked SusC/RagA family outer membrane protein [Chitinophaga niastensis]